MKLEIKNAQFSFSPRSTPVLQNLNFEIASGSYWCLAGPNGAGKSTLLRLAAGLIDFKFFTGNASWILKEAKRPIQSFSRNELAHYLAFVPGSLKSHFSISIEAFVLQGRYIHSPFLSRASQSDLDIARAAMSRVGIDSIAYSLIDEVSAGELQLALIARALCQQPSVLILDEATANLDLGHQAKIYSLLHGLNSEGMTILLVTHDLNISAEFCPNLAWMKSGSIIAHGKTEEMLTTEHLQKIYGDDVGAKIGRNPFTNKPKIFWT